MWCRLKSLVSGSYRVTLAVTALAGLLTFQPTVDAQLICDSLSHDCAAGDCSCPGCAAFFDSMSPEASTAPEAIADGGPSDTLAPAPSIEDLAAIDQPLSTGSFASTLGSVSGGRGIPSMIGDFFGSGFNYVQFPGGAFGGPASGNNATIAIAGGDRQFKLSENNSPFPTDRVFFNYHHFHNAVINSSGDSENLDRYTFGIEKTFWNGLASFEVRTPFAHTVTASPSVFQTRDQTDTEFGNISLAVKGLLCQTECFATAAGLGIVLPTGDDFVVQSNVPNRFENGAVRLQPFLGVYHAPTSRLFTQFFTQLDFDAGDSEVMIGSSVDELQMQTLLMLDYSVGYWLARNRCARYIRAIAPMVELHYTTTLEDQEYGIFSGQGIFVEEFRRDVLNITGGVFFQLGNMSSLKVGAVLPLRDEDDKLFDSELGLQFVRNF